MRSAFLLCAVFVAMLFSGCQRDNHPRLPAGPEPVLPTVGPSAISTVGGHAQALPGRSAGDSGSLFINVTGGRLMTDDGRARPMPADNFLEDLLSEGVVTWDMLQAKQAPVISAGVATFTLAGAGIHLPSDARLDLSGAPFDGGIPSGDVALVEFIADQAIRVDGEIITRRVDRNAVGIRLTTSHADGISVDGSVNTGALPGFNAGHVEFAAPNGPVIARGRVRAEGGVATEARDGGRGGNVTLSAGMGALLLRAGAWRTHGHPGQERGGDGGLIMLTARNTATTGFAWTPVTYGGNGVDGDGGRGGDVIIDVDATVEWFTRFETHGGKSTGGNGGDGGEVLLFSHGHSGRLDVRGDAGTSAQNDGGRGSQLHVLGEMAWSLFATVDARGGGGGARGGDGGGLQVNVNSLLEDSEFHVRANGGGGTTQGGNGGSAFLTATGPAVVRRVSLHGDVRGGASLGAGGVGGGAGINAPAASIQLSSLHLDVYAQGGSGANGGSGGALEIFLVTGSASGTLKADVTGGASTSGTGGGGGLIDVVTAGGGIDLDLAASAQGGRGVTGGPGGTVSVNGGYAAASGSVKLTGTISARGGRGDNGGNGGAINLRGGDAGLLLDGAIAEANGGEGGGAGGSILLESSGGLLVDGGSISANGDGSGHGGAINALTDGTAITLRTRLNATGGAEGGNGGTMFLFSAGGGFGVAGSVRIASVASLNLRGGENGAGGTLVIDAWAPAGGNIFVEGNVIATGGSGGPGGNVTLLNEGGSTHLTSQINVSGGDGGSIFAGMPVSLIVDDTARLIANGTGVAGFITLDPQGTGPDNPALTIFAGATLETKDGNGTDQSATNIILD